MFEEATDSLEPGGVLFAYTDGLVERRDEHLDVRLDLLAHETTAALALPLRRLPEVIQSKLLGDDAARLDDAAMIALQIASADELHLRLPAEPASLVVVRRALDGFLVRAGATPEEVFDLKVACGEACANVIQHAYGSGGGLIRINAANTERGLALGVRDTGNWGSRARRDDETGGHGLTLMRGLVDHLDVARDATGTEVTLVRRLGKP
jgi:anti-sigma regulatory factor (Ser/Thr protein kinase)